MTRARPAPSTVVATVVAAAAAALLGALALPGAARAQQPPAPPPTSPPATAPAVLAERYYEILKSGQKVGYSAVRWTASTWGGKPTVHDTTTIVTRSVRNMGGHTDTFESTTTLEIERGEDGTLWSMRTTVLEGGRPLVEDLSWNGAGYDHVTRVAGAEQRVAIPLEAPVMTDAESFAGARLRQGGLKVGDRLALRELDVRARAARDTALEVLPAATIEGEAGPVACTPLRQRDPQSGAESTLWLDAQGAFVQLKDDGGTTYRRAPRERAIDLPRRPHTYPITAPASPTLERVFTASKHRVDLFLAPDPDRKLPDLPDSPWSRVVGRRGDDASGWVLELELSAYDDPAADAPLPLDPKALPAGVDPSDLEPTTLLPSQHPELVRAAREVVGDAATLREAARRLARWVYANLEKQSPAAPDPTALEVLRLRQGDCSEHAVLFVALCRAAGVPARRCRGYVSLGSIWGAHSFAEVWVGRWIAADPTTGEVGGGARYVFFGYPDRAGSFPGVVAERVTGRMRFVSRSITTPPDEGGETFDVADRRAQSVVDRAAGRARHLLCGIELVGLPADWQVEFPGPAMASVRGPRLAATISVQADQGGDLASWGSGDADGTFCGVPAVVHAAGEGRRSVLVHSRRRFVRVWVSESTPETLAALEAALAPTFRAAP